jgi:hypothetical protein
MKRHLSRIAVITAVAFGIFLGGGGFGPDEADARYRHIGACYLEATGGPASDPNVPINSDC